MKTSAKSAGKKGLNVINGDIFEIDIPEADVYYFWLSLQPAEKILAKLREQKREGIVIRGFISEKSEIFGDLIISCPRRWKGGEDFKIQIIKL